jgi:guanylate kinase
MTDSPRQPAVSRGKLIVISGPSGVGKSTIAHEIEKRLDAVFSVSMTTRPQTPKDREGIDYFFVTPDVFQQAIRHDRLLEWAKVFDNLYGTPREPVEQHLRDGRNVILEIDVEGGQQVKQTMPESLAIFIEPPSEDVLLQRLRDRGREDESIIQRRFREAKREIEQAHRCGAYDHFVINDELESAIGQTIDMIQNAAD